MVFTSTQLILLVQEWMWPFFRIAGLLMVAPVIGTRSVPVRIRLIIAIAITLVIAPVVPSFNYVDPLSIKGLFISIEQVVIGIAMGLTVRVIFVALEVAGQMIGQLMGLMLASMVDPTNGNQVPIIGQFYLLLATLLFLAIDGHLFMIRHLAESFYLMPIGNGGISQEGIWIFINWISVVLATAVLIALPVIVSMLIVNIGFGVLTRSAPQLNIFAVGFPIMIIMGILVIMITLDSFVPQMIHLIEKSISMMNVFAQ